MVLATTALVGAGLSLIGDSADNKQARENAKRQVKSVWRNANIQMNSLAELGDELATAQRLELLDRELDGLKNQAVTTNTVVESGIAGNAAQRLYNSDAMQSTLRTNQVKQKAEAAMKDVQRKMTNVEYDYENKVNQINENLANNTKSGFDMAVGAFGAFTSLGGSFDSKGED